MSVNLQLFLFILIAAAALLLLRIFVFSGEISSEDLYADSQKRTDNSAVRTGEAPISNDLGRVRVTQFNFSHFDAVPGPPDPECFADELILELYDSVSDFRWTATYVVATPAGIRKMMDDERWNFFYATEIFVVRRYDLETIREAVYGRIKEVHEQVALGPDDPPLAG